MGEEGVSYNGTVEVVPGEGAILNLAASIGSQLFRMNSTLEGEDVAAALNDTLSGLIDPLDQLNGSNSTILMEKAPSCPYDYLPSLPEYHNGLDQVWLSFGLTLSSLATILVIALYLDTLRHILTRVHSSCQANTIMVLSLYPVVSMVSLAATMVPRAQFIMETVAHLMFMVALYHMFCLTLEYAGGESGFVAVISPAEIDPRVGPCCCWPCCFFLPSISPTKRRMKFLRALVIQASVVQGFIYIMYLILASEDKDLFHTVYNYMLGVVVCSVLSSIWGLVMTVSAAFEPMKHFFIKEKFIVFQLVLVLTKFQMFGARLIAQTNLFPCNYPITPSLYTNLIYNVFVSWEMVLLCFLARKLYKRPLKSPDSMCSLAANLPAKISTIQDKIPPSEMIKDNNNSTIVVRF